MFSFPAVAQLQVHGIKTLAFLAPTTSVQQRLVEPADPEQEVAVEGLPLEVDP